MKKNTLILLVSICFFLAPFVTSAQGAINVREKADTVEIDNNLVKAQFVTKKEYIEQKYFAKQSGQWVLVVESFRPPEEFPADGVQLFNSGIDKAHRLIATEGLNSVKIKEQKEDTVKIILTGSFRNATVEQTVQLNSNDNFFHIEISSELPGSPAKLEYLLSTFTLNLNKAPDFVYTPSLKDRVDDIIGDRAFYSPAVILQEGNLFTALVPDVDMINEYQILSPDARRARVDLDSGAERLFGVGLVDEFMTMPTGLDLNIRSGLTDKPIFSFGMIDVIPNYHVRWRHPNDGSMVRTLGENTVHYGFDLFIGAETPENIGYQMISRYQWEKYGRKEMEDARPQALPLEEYAKKIYEKTFQPMGEFHPPIPGYEDNGSFLKFEIDGQPVGGYRVTATFWNDLLDNMAWWNNMSDAVGFYYWGEKLNDPDLIDKARRTLNLALLAPQDNGLFPLIYRASDKKWIGNHFDPPLDQPSFEGQFVDEGGYQFWAYYHVNPNRFLTAKGWDSKSYNIASCSKTAAHMIQYYKQCEPDQRIISYVKRYADYMLTQIDDNGTVPAWITYDMTPHWVLRNSAHNGATMWFLAELYNVTNEQKYLDGAERIARFMTENILPRQDWKDQEHYFSCGPKPLWYKDDMWQGLPTRGVLSQIWAMEGFKSLYEASGKQKYLTAGEQVVDFFGFSQSSWNPHYIYTAYPFGGVDTDNGDAAWINGHTHHTSHALVWYGLELGRQDILERGVAAAHASLTLIKNDRHTNNNIYSHFSSYPLTTLITDWTAGENIEHGSWPCDGNRAAPGLCEGSGVNSGVGQAYRMLGGAYVNIKKDLAIGVNGVRIEDVKLNGRRLIIRAEGTMSKLKQPWEQPYETDMRIVGLPDDGIFELILNDSEPVDLSAEGLASIIIEVSPGGNVSVKQ